MKRIKRYLSILLVFSMMLCSTAVFPVSAVQEAEDNENVAEVDENLSGEDELQPMSAMSSHQYADRYFNSLIEAKQYYGFDYTYTECEVFYHPPGCYGGYWSNGGYYNFYYTTMSLKHFSS